MSAKRTDSGLIGNGSGRRIALFGGTFDPIHVGHLAVARAASRRFHLDEVHFIPSAFPPHKSGDGLSPFAHRFAMVALACAGHSQFLPSLAESPADGVASRSAFYSVDTVRRFRRRFRAPGHRLFFLLGADSFLHIASWKHYEILLGLCDFVVAHRPGFPTEALRKVIPPELLRKPSTEASAGGPSQKRGNATGKTRAIPLRRTTVYLLDTVASDVSATGVRRHLDRGQSVRGLVPPRVEEYITKMALYK